MTTSDGGAYRAAITKCCFQCGRIRLPEGTENALGFAANRTVHARRLFWLDRCVCLRSMINALSI